MSEAFARVPLWILGRSDLSWPAKVLYGLLARYIGRQGSAWPSVQTIADDMRSSRRNVDRWLAELRTAGLIDVERTGRASTYRILGSAPDEAPEDAILRPRSATDDASDATEPAHQMRHERRTSSAASDVSDAPPVTEQLRREWRNVPPDTSFCEEIKEEIREETRARATERSESALERARRLLVGGYGRRYEIETKDAWMGASASGGPITTVATWCALEPEHVDERVELVLDGLFGDAWATERRWPWGPVAKDPARYAELGRAARRKASQAARRAAIEAEREAQERARYEAEDREAAPPPAGALASLKSLVRGVARTADQRRDDHDRAEAQRLEDRRLELQRQAAALEATLQGGRS